MKKRLDSVQAMRAVAALLVVMFHSGREAVKRAGSGASPLLAFFETCDFGVDIFFIISGFIMYYVTVGKPVGPEAAREFLRRRIVRVVPMYWLFTTLFILPLLFAPALLNRTAFTLPFIVSSYLFVPWQRPAAGIPSLTPIFGVGWTLNYEMMFYAAFALLIALRIESRLLWLAIGFGLLSILGFFMDPAWAQIFFWTRSSLIEFVAGVALAAAYVRDRELSLAAGLGALVAGIAVWQAAAFFWPIHDLVFNWRGFAWGFAAGAIMSAVVLNARLARLVAGPTGSLIQKLGDASFSLYLSHLFVIRVTTVVLRKLHLLGVPMALVVVNIVTTSIVALLVFRFVEKPLERFAATRVWRGRPPQILPPGA